MIKDYMSGQGILNYFRRDKEFNEEFFLGTKKFLEYKRLDQIRENWTQEKREAENQQGSVLPTSRERPTKESPQLGRARKFAEEVDSFIKYVRQLEETLKWQKFEVLLQKCFQHDDAETSAETAPSGNRSIGVVVTPSLPNPGNDISLILVDEIVPDDIKQKSHQHHDESIYDIDEIFVDKNECFEGNSPGTNVTNTLSNIDRNIKDLPILPSSYTSQNPPQILRREILPIGLKSLEKEGQVSNTFVDTSNNKTHINDDRLSYIQFSDLFSAEQQRVSLQGYLA